MSTRTPTPTTRPTTTGDETTGAPLTFATDNEVPITGLFDAESDQH
ncbi:hypothetical protein ACOZ4N_06455 [Halorientalis pallida]